MSKHIAFLSTEEMEVLRAYRAGRDTERAIRVLQYFEANPLKEIRHGTDRNAARSTGTGTNPTRA